MSTSKPTMLRGRIASLTSSRVSSTFSNLPVFDDIVEMDYQPVSRVTAPSHLQSEAEATGFTDIAKQNNIYAAGGIGGTGYSPEGGIGGTGHSPAGGIGGTGHSPSHVPNNGLSTIHSTTLLNASLDSPGGSGTSCAANASMGATLLNDASYALSGIVLSTGISIVAGATSLGEVPELPATNSQGIGTNTGVINNVNMQNDHLSVASPSPEISSLIDVDTLLHVLPTGEVSTALTTANLVLTSDTLTDDTLNSVQETTPANINLTDLFVDASHAFPFMSDANATVEVLPTHSCHEFENTDTQAFVVNIPDDLHQNLHQLLIA